MGGRADHDAARAELLSAALAPDGILDLRRLRRFVPAQWAGQAAVGLDGVVRVDLPQADAASADGSAPLPAPLQEQLAAVAPALSGQPLSGEQAVDALEAAHRLTTLLAGVRLEATRELTARTAEKALQLKGVTSPEELSATGRERWRARSKSVTATELSALTGMGRGTAREVVAVANAPRSSAVPARQALDAGTAGWDLVAAWWRRCARMGHEASAEVARALFSSDVPPEQAAAERLTPEGELSTAPWAKKQFFEALERHALAQEAADPAAQQRKRESRHAARDAYGIVDDDGSAQIVITADAASVTASLERLQTLARQARDAGDRRTVAQLRSDLARALLVHGTLPLPDLGPDPRLITPDDIDRLVDVLSGTPAHEVQVIVPWDVLSGHAALVNSAATATPTAKTAIATAAAPAAATSTSKPPNDDTPPAPLPGSDAVEGVGRVLGRFSRFLTGAEVRRIAGRPGTTLYRLLTDPADGRCIERTLARYAPDAAMRAQLRAADVLSRAPGSTVPARSCDLDHVEEYLLGGTTSETNLQAVERPWHALKTEKFWDAAMDASRNVTWESFWGRLYRTRAHDYRQYLTRQLSVPEQAERRQPNGRRPDRQQSRPPGSGAGRPALSATEAAGAGLDPDRAEELTPEEQRHLASLLVYAALAHRAPADRLEAPDDDPDSDTEILGLREAIWLRRTTASGRRTTGTRPDLPAPEHLLTHDPRALLDHPDWTSLGRPRPEPGPGHLPAAGPGTKPGDDSTGDGAAAPPPF